MKERRKEDPSAALLSFLLRPLPLLRPFQGFFPRKFFDPPTLIFYSQKIFSEAFLRNRQDHNDDDRHNRLAGGGDVALIRFFVCGGGRCFLGSDRMTARPHSRLRILEHLFLENPLHYMILRTMRTTSEYPLFVKIITLSCSMLSILNYCENNHSLHGVIVNRLTIAYICVLRLYYPKHCNYTKLSYNTRARVLRHYLF